MSNRYHLPIVVTTTDGMGREETAEYIERMLSDIEEDVDIYRAYVEKRGVKPGEVDRLLTMLDRVEAEDIDAAIESIKTISENDENT